MKGTLACFCWAKKCTNKGVSTKTCFPKWGLRHILKSNRLRTIKIVLFWTTSSIGKKERFLCCFQPSVLQWAFLYQSYAFCPLAWLPEASWIYATTFLPITTTGDKLSKIVFFLEIHEEHNFALLLNFRPHDIARNLVEGVHFSECKIRSKKGKINGGQISVVCWLC